MSYRDLFTPEFLSDPLLREVQPASLIAWYGTPEGQWFPDEIAAACKDGTGCRRWSRFGGSCRAVRG